MSRSKIDVLTGTVFAGSNNAASNLADVAPIIAERVGLDPLEAGTLNVRLPEHYPITAVTALVTDVEYQHQQECIKLRRCRIRRAGAGGAGLRGVVIRPSQHENPVQEHWTRLEVMSPVHLRGALGVENDDLVEVELERGWKEQSEWWKG